MVLKHNDSIGAGLMKLFKAEFIYTPQGASEPFIIPITGYNLHVARKVAEGASSSRGMAYVKQNTKLRESVTNETIAVLREHDIKPISFMFDLVQAFRDGDPQLAPLIAAMEAFVQEGRGTAAMRQSAQKKQGGGGVISPG